MANGIELQRHTPKETTIILYYSFLGFHGKVVSEIIHLKTGSSKVSPQQCLERISFTRDEDFPKHSLAWNETGVSQRIAQLVDYDTFMDLIWIDVRCQELLEKVSHGSQDRISTYANYNSKHKHIGRHVLDVLKSGNSLKKTAAIKIREKARDDERVAQEIASRKKEDEWMTQEASARVHEDEWMA